MYICAVTIARVTKTHVGLAGGLVSTLLNGASGVIDGALGLVTGLHICEHTIYNFNFQFRDAQHDWRCQYSSTNTC